MKNKKIAKELIDFIDDSPSCYHVIYNIAGGLDDYTRLYEEESWTLEPGGKYYVIRKDSSIIAFDIPSAGLKDVRISASHCDSPSFKLKPDADTLTDGNYCRLNVEKYGGMIMSSWLDRPLSVAGRIVFEDKKGNIRSRLLNIDKDLCIIPSVAIHFNRTVNDGYKFDPKCDTIPLLGCADVKGSLYELIAKDAGVKPEDILGSDLFLYPRTKGTILGINEEYVSSRALDDLQCVFGTFEGFVNSEKNESTLAMYCVFDNEEVGSTSAVGADSTFLSDTLSRIKEALHATDTDMLKAIAKGFMISADNAHAVHPNHPEISDKINQPHINEGIVIKYQAGQKYTTDGISEAIMKRICKKASVPFQTFTNRADLAGGSTLGNIANTHVSIRTVDVGLPQLAMHSAYETAGVKDTEYLSKAVKTFYEMENM